MTLLRKEVHIWKVPLDIDYNCLAELSTILSRDEIERAQKFRFEIHAKRFIACRGRLRIILGHYLEKLPHHLQFGYCRYGKPYLHDELHDLKLQFNVSHSQDMALFAISCASRVGVDVEQIRDIPNMLNIARGVLTDREYSSVNSHLGRKRIEHFFQLWTRKEAYVKAVGCGLTYEMNKIDVLIEDNTTYQTALTENEINHTTSWMLYDLTGISSTYMGAVVVEGSTTLLRHYTWDMVTQTKKLHYYQ